MCVCWGGGGGVRCTDCEFGRFLWFWRNSVWLGALAPHRPENSAGVSGLNRGPKQGPELALLVYRLHTTRGCIGRAPNPNY